MNRDLRFSVPLTAKELRLVQKAAKIVGEKPSPFARDVLKRISRQILQKSGVKVRLDMDDFVEDGSGATTEVATEE